MYEQRSLLFPLVNIDRFLNLNSLHCKYRVSETSIFFFSPKTFKVLGMIHSCHLFSVMVFYPLLVIYLLLLFSGQINNWEVHISVL
jgi:hypothetical protein